MKKKIFLEGSGVRVVYPHIDFFIDKIVKKEPFKYLKICHALFDGIIGAYKDNLDDFKKLLLAEDYEAIGKRMVESKTSDIEMGRSFWHGTTNDLTSQYVTAIKVLHQNKNLSDNIIVSVSLGVGLGTFWGVWDHMHRIQEGRRIVMGMLDSSTYHNYHYAGSFKHYTIKNEIYKLFYTLNQYDYNVGFFGPTYFSRFKDVFNIRNFTHLEIPVKNASENLEGEIERIRQFAKTSDKQSIVFLQCGATMACTIIDVLKDENITIIDAGRSFDLLLKVWKLRFSL